MEKQLEVIKALTDHLITIFDLADINKKKIEAIKAQEYYEAAKLREREKELESNMITVEKIKEIRAKLDLPTKQN